jgi:hypothetical protein
MPRVIPDGQNRSLAFAITRRCATLAFSVLVLLWTATFGANSQVTFGGLQIGFPGGGQLRMDSLSVEDVGYSPGAVTLDELTATIRSLGSARPEQAVEQFAAFFEGARLGKFEIRGFSLTHPELGRLDIAAMRLERLEQGRLGAFVLEGLVVGSPHADDVKIERLAIRGFGIASLMRAAAAAAGGLTNLDALTGVGGVLEEIELVGFVVPFKIDDRPITVERLELKWRDFVGPIPTSLDLNLKTLAPIDPNLGEQTRALTAAGFDTAAVGLTVNSAWMERTGQSTLRLAFETAGARLGTGNSALTSPPNAVVGLFSMSLNATAENVSRELFNLNPNIAKPASAAVRAGLMEIILRDTGGFDLGLASVVRELFNSVKDARPGSQRARLRTALSAFLDGPRATLTVKIAPKEPMAIMAIVERLSQPPADSPNAPDVYEIFNIEASTTR